MGLFEAAVVVDRTGAVTQPGQHTVLQLSGFRQRAEQCVTGREFDQGLRIKRSIKQVRTHCNIDGFDDEHVADDIRRGLMFADQGQLADDNRLPIDDPVGGKGFHQCGDITGAKRRDAAFFFQAQFQRVQRQLNPQVLSVQTLALLGVGCVT